MYKSNLISVLRQLDPKEFREFGELVHSPFFNKNQSVVSLYEYLKKSYPEFTAEKVEKEFVYSKIFHKSEYNDGFMRTVIFNLSSLAEEYLKQLNLRKNKAASSLMLLDELNARKIEKLLLKNLAETEKEIEKSIEEGRDYYFYRYRFDALNDNYTNWSRFKNRNMQDFLDKNLLMENKNLAAYFLITAFANYRLMLFKRESVSIDFEFTFLDEIISYISSHEDEFADYPAVIMHLNEIQLLKTKEEKYYSKLKKFLDTEAGITIDNKYSLSNILQLYCQHRVYQGDNEYLSESFGLYKRALEKNFYKASQDIYFDSLVFPNIARAAMKIGEFEWAADFIDKYKDELSPELKDLIVGYLKGRLHFEKKEPEKALESVKEIKSIKHMQYKVVFRNLLLMIYYDLSYFDQAEYQLASYRQYISKHEKTISKPRVERISEFLKYYAALLRLKSKDPGKAEDILAELNGNTRVLERTWLIEKAGQLM